MGLRDATFVFLILATGCRPARPGEARQVVPEVTMDGVRFQVDRQGVTTASGEAERLTYRRDTTDVAVRGLAMDLASSGGKIRVTAPEGSGHLGSRHFRVSGGIRATRGSDVALTPSAVSHPGPDGRVGIHGDEAVQVAGPGYRLTGTGFDIAPSTGEVEVHGRPHLVTGLGSRP
jgi:lipopolysaccharide export system protein LptC